MHPHARAHPRDQLASWAKGRIGAMRQAGVAATVVGLSTPQRVSATMNAARIHPLVAYRDRRAQLARSTDRLSVLATRHHLCTSKHSTHELFRALRWRSRLTVRWFVSFARRSITLRRDLMPGGRPPKKLKTQAASDARHRNPSTGAATSSASRDGDESRFQLAHLHIRTHTPLSQSTSVPSHPHSHVPLLSAVRGCAAAGIPRFELASDSQVRRSWRLSTALTTAGPRHMLLVSSRSACLSLVYQTSLSLCVQGASAGAPSRSIAGADTAHLAGNSTPLHALRLVANQAKVRRG